MVIEQLHNKIKDKLDPFQIVCDSRKIELHDSKGLRIDLCSRISDIHVEVKKKCAFSGFFDIENSFVWHIKDDQDIEILISRLHKIRETSIDGGPYGFSKRSTYIKRKNNMPFAMSGNFATQASVNKVVVIGDGGIIMDDISIPDREPWFLIDISIVKQSRNSDSMNSMAVLYNMEHWWPVKNNDAGYGFGRKPERHATSVLSRTEGKLLTMHDKFVIDLAVKLFNENREE